MSGRVEAVLTALGIVPTQVTSDWIWALCPFHDDHNPSWRIRTSQHRYGQHVCYACKVGGHLVRLPMHVLGLSEEAARAWLEEVGGKEPPAEEVAASVDVEVVGATVGRFVLPQVSFGPLSGWPSQARAYAQGRGIDEEQVRAWGIGHAVYGRLAGRIVLVVRDRRGIPVSYQARDYFGGQRARYLTPREDENADRDVMFGEHRWRSRGAVVVVEGGLNALAVERAMRGHECEVASIGGSEVRAAHVQKLSAFRRVVVMTDMDKVGEKAAAELRWMLASRSSVARVELHGGDACDAGREELRAILLASAMTVTS